MVSSDGNQSVQALAFSLASLQESPALGPSKPNHNESEDDNMVSSSKRLERCRERNREHARRTRIRKKVQLEALQKKCKNLQEEQAKLKQVVEDRRVASILLNLSGNADPTQPQIELPPTNEGSNAKQSQEDDEERNDETLSWKKRKTPSPNTLCISIDGVPTVFSTKAHVNWKTGAYVDSQGEQKRLNAHQLESLRYVLHSSSHCYVPHSMTADGNAIDCMPK